MWTFSSQADRSAGLAVGATVAPHANVAFLCVRDKACQHQRCLRILVWPSARTFCPSHVSGLTHDPNWSPPRRSQAEVFKFRL